MTDLTGQPDLPRATQFAPNGDRFTNITFLDYNAMYLDSQQKMFPTTPGILWDRRPTGGKTEEEATSWYFTKSVMTTGTSLESLQWLIHTEEFDTRLTSSSGERVKLQHAYFRGEHSEGPYKIDGFAIVDDKKYFWEFLGCYYHPDCPNDCKATRSNNWSEESKNEVSFFFVVLLSKN